MSKLLGGRSADAVSLVEAPVSRSYAVRARIAFFAVSIGVALVLGAALSAVWHPVKAGLVGLLAGVVCGLVVGVVIRVWPVLRVLWWWSVEIVTAVLVVGGTALLSRLTHPVLGVAVVVVLAGVLAAVGPLRRLVMAWGLCVVVRHRLRLCFAEVIRSANRSHPACLPLVLWARPTPAGERVWLWLRPGLDLTDLEGKTGKVAVTCWAGEVRMVRASTRFAAWIRVDISRRDPLTGLVHTTLLDLLSATADAPAPVSPGMPPLGLDLDDIGDPEPPANGRGPRR